MNFWKKSLFDGITGVGAKAGVLRPEGTRPGAGQRAGCLRAGFLWQVGSIVEKQGWRRNWKQRKRERIFLVF